MGQELCKSKKKLKQAPEAFAVLVQDPRFVEFTIENKLNPIIVPPLLGKADLPKMITAQWRSAIRA